MTRDVSYAAQERHRGGQAGSVANSGDGKKFNSRQPGMSSVVKSESQS